MLRLLSVLALLSGCTSLITLRADTNDYLKDPATRVSLNAPITEVQPVLDELFFQRGFRSSGIQRADNGSQVIIYKGPRQVPPEAAAYGVQLGSWFAARITNTPTTTDVQVMGKPMVGSIEICSDHDDAYRDVRYVCTDTRVPTDWVGKNLVSGRDESEVVEWVVTGLYERLKR
jgi:hypothetical protein